MTQIRKELKFIHVTKTGGTTIENLGKDNNILWGRFHKEYGWWHQPFNKKTLNLKKKYDWFLVVRNPYDRVISEFYCKWGTPIKKDKYNVSDNEFNEIIKYYINNRLTDHTKLGIGHYLEQYKYYDEKFNIRILKFENIKSDFQKLMSDYNINITIDRCDNKNIKVKTIESLSEENIKLINKIYHKDFELFNYEKIIV